MKYRFLSFFLITFCFVTLSASAQVPISVGGLELSASTDNPIPGQTVTITARSFILDINTAKITWTTNGTQAQSGTGLTTLEVQAPALGKKTVVNVNLTTTDGRTVSSSITVGSGSVDMIIETDGYVPPFFRGKLSPVYQNSIEIVAIPHIANSAGVEYDPKTLSYEWKRNGRVLESQSGYGKQSITLVGDIVPRPFDVSVTAASPDNTARAAALAQISFGGPVVRFYVDDPLYGTLFNRSITDTLRIGTQKETTVTASPFGFNKPAGGIAGFTWSWSVNGSIRNELTSKESVVLRAPANAVGTSDILLDIRNPAKILQGISSGFTASYTAEKSTQNEPVTF